MYEQDGTPFSQQSVKREKLRRALQLFQLPSPGDPLRPQWNAKAGRPVCQSTICYSAEGLFHIVNKRFARELSCILPRSYLSPQLSNYIGAYLII